MTIICWDTRMLAADTLTSAGEIKVYNRSKIQILKQMAVCTTGFEQDGDRFLEWLDKQDRENFTVESYFCALVLSRTSISMYPGDEPGNVLRSEVYNKTSCGAGSAASYADALMREVKYNAHNAAEQAAGYDRGCGLPIYSITKKQLSYIHADFTGYWIGTYQTPISKIKDYLITQKQWLKT